MKSFTFFTKHSSRSITLLATSLGLGLCCHQTLNAQANIQPIIPGYFSDPYLVPFEGLYISGTELSYRICLGDLSPNCGQFQQLNIDKSNLAAKADAAGAKFTIAGVHPFKNANNVWMMALTLHMQPKNATGGAIDGWSVIAHATPVGTNITPPTEWRTTDTLLIGSFTNPNVKANYDGKYYENDGQLYLIYQKRLSDTPGRDGIVAQKMTTPTDVAPADPVILLRPSNQEDAKVSELYDPGRADGLKLVETGNIVKINGKFVMAYSVGGYNTPYYKVGIAYSDTFLPQSGEGTYRKVTHADPGNVWGENGGSNREIYYLLQAQKPNWPNYVGNQVIAPGVPTITNYGPGGSWVVVFAGHNPGDNPNNLDPSQRRPFYARISVNIPGDDTKVSQVDEETLGNWIQLTQ